MNRSVLFLLVALPSVAAEPAHSARKLTSAEVGVFLQRGAELNERFAGRRGLVQRRLPGGSSGLELPLPPPAGPSEIVLSELIFERGQAYAVGDTARVTKVTLTRHAIEVWLDAGGYAEQGSGGGKREIEASTIATQRELARREADRRLPAGMADIRDATNDMGLLLMEKVAADREANQARNARHVLAKRSGARLRFTARKGLSLEQLEPARLEAIVRDWIRLEEP